MDFRGRFLSSRTSPPLRRVAHDDCLVVFEVIGSDFRDQPKNVDAAQGSDVVIDCRPPKGEPEPRVRWRKDNDPVKSADRFTIAETGSLRIKDVHKEDGGTYVCIAYNIGGEKESAPARLAVRGLSFILNHYHIVKSYNVYHIVTG